MIIYCLRMIGQRAQCTELGILMNFSEFESALIGVAEKRHDLFLHGEEAYITKVWGEIGPDWDGDLNALAERVFNRDFLSDGDPPRWLFEPFWPIVLGNPMNFVCQHDSPDGRESIYFFRYERQLDDDSGHEIGYCAIEQTKRSTGFPIGFVGSDGSLRLGFDRGDCDIMKPV